MMQKFTKFTFDDKIFNQILVMWLIRSSLPWNRMGDFYLNVAFNYVWRGTKVFSRTWAATEAHRLYLNLQEKVLSELKVQFYFSFIEFHFNQLIILNWIKQGITSKISLIHDVWTTKGNRSAFMGISVSYISENWIYKVKHLSLKYISWTHKGKYLAVSFANILIKSSLYKNISFISFYQGYIKNLS